MASRALCGHDHLPRGYFGVSEGLWAGNGPIFGPQWAPYLGLSTYTLLGMLFALLVINMLPIIYTVYH